MTSTKLREVLNSPTTATMKDLTDVLHFFEALKVKVDMLGEACHGYKPFGNEIDDYIVSTKSYILTDLFNPKESV